MVMDTLGIEIRASNSDNMRTFKRVTVGTEVFTYGEVVVWFRMLSKISNCQGLAACAEEYMYAHRLVVEDEMDQVFVMTATRWIHGTDCGIFSLSLIF